MATPRGKSKQALVAHAVAVAKAFEKTGAEIRTLIEVMTDSKTISERQMVEEIHAAAVATLHEAPLVELWTRLSEYEVHNELERRR